MHALYAFCIFSIDLLQVHFVFIFCMNHMKSRECHGITCEQLGPRYLFSMRQELLPEGSTGCSSSAAVLFSFLHFPSLPCSLETRNAEISAASELENLQTMHFQWSWGSDPMGEKKERQLFITRPFLVRMWPYLIWFHCSLLAPGVPFFVYSQFSVLNSSQYQSLILVSMPPQCCCCFAFPNQM